MRDTVAIGDKNVEMLSNGAIDIVYRQIFHEDAIKTQYEMEDDDVPSMLNMMMRMGFIMAKAAEIPVRDQMQLTEADFVEWLAQFDRSDYVNALPDIRTIYEGQKVPTAESKKNQDQPTDQ